MAFEIKPIDPVLFAEIYTPRVAKELDQYIFASRNWVNDLSGRRWAIDDARRACVVWVHMIDRMNSDHCFALIWNEQVVLIKEVEYCCYSIVYASSTLGNRLSEAKEMIGEALRAGGRFLRGALETEKSNLIPRIQFIE